jgi:hypothetical protein
VTVEAAPAYTIAANLRWLSVAYVIIEMIVAAILIGASFAGFDLPATGASVGAYAGAVSAAGYRFAGRRPDWTSKDRHALALGYLLASVVVSCALIGLYLAFDQSPISDFLDLVAQGGLGLVIGFVIFAAVLYYALGRFMLRFIARRVTPT